MATLGAMMLSERAIEDVRAVLTSYDFYQPAHGEICRAIFYLDKKGTPVDLVTIRDRLTETKKLEGVGGIEYVIQIAESVPTAKNARYYAEIVADKAKMRRLEEASREMQSVVRDPELSADEKLQKAESILERAMVSKSSASFQSITQLQKLSIAEVDEAIESGKARKGISTGFTDLDRWLTGLYPGHFYIVASRPGMGKSAFAGAVAFNVARSVGPVAFMSLEMPARMVNDRLLCADAGITTGRLMSGEMTSEEIQRVYDASERMRDVPLFVDDSPDQTVASIKSRVRRLRGEHGSLALVIVDYIQLLKASRRYDNRQVEVSEVSRGLKELSKDLNVPIWALAQVGRDVEKRGNKRPGLSDLRESGDIEASADVVAFLYRHEYYKPKSGEQQDLRMDVAEVCETIIAKHRNGPQGTVLLGFVPAHTKFCQLSDDSKENYRAKMRSKDKE